MSEDALIGGMKSLLGTTVELMSISNSRCVGKLYKVMAKKGVVLKNVTIYSTVEDPPGSGIFFDNVDQVPFMSV